MKHLLQNIYTLQKIDSLLDELEELKGDLPKEKKKTSSEIESKNQFLKEAQTNIENYSSQKIVVDETLIKYKKNIEKYRHQQIEVKTNKQYDALAKEIEFSQLEVKKLEKEFSEIEKNIHILKSDSEIIQKELPKLIQELESIENELQNFSSENEEEEKKLLSDKEKILKKISNDDLANYEKIRNAKNGKAVAKIIIKEVKKKTKEASCGGCFHRLPPEKMVELRQVDKIHTCESCGRIIVPEEIASEIDPIYNI